MINLSISIAGLILAILGVVLVLHYRKQRFLCYDVISESQFELLKRDNRVSAVFDGRTVESVVHHTVYLWNPSTLEIPSSKVSSDDPLRIAFSSESDILVEAVNVIGGVEDASIEFLDDNVGRIYFSNFDRSSGLRIEITELTAAKRKLEAPQLSGRIFGGYEKIQRVPVRNPMSLGQNAWAWVFFSLVVGGFSAANVFDPQSDPVSKYDVYMIYVLNISLASVFIFNIRGIISNLRFRPPKGIFEK